MNTTKTFKQLFWIFIIYNISACSSINESDSRPNILVIYTDDMNYKDLGFYGGEVLTPSMDRLFAEGIELTNFRDCSAVCSPSRFNLLTGKYASRSKSLLHQFPESDPPFLRWNVNIDHGERTLAHVLNDAHYKTGMVGKYHSFENEYIHDSIPEDANPKDPEIQSRIRANYEMLRDTIQKTSGFDYLENIYANNLHWRYQNLCNSTIWIGLPKELLILLMV